MCRIRVAIVLVMGIIPIATLGIASASGPSGAFQRLQTAAISTAYTGTADVSDLSLPRFDLPTTSLADTGAFSATVRFAVRDRSHFRIDIQITSPALDTGTLSVAANGTTITTMMDARTWPSRRRFRASIVRRSSTTLWGPWKAEPSPRSAL